MGPVTTLRSPYYICYFYSNIYCILALYDTVLYFPSWKCSVRILTTWKARIFLVYLHPQCIKPSASHILMSVQMCAQSRVKVKNAISSKESE